MDTSAVINVNVQSNDTPQAQYKTVVLKPNMVDDVNTLTQAMLTAHGQNTKFVIKYDFTLGEDITVPANCVLEFDGGSISGYGTGKDTITSDNLTICSVGKCFSNIKFGGKCTQSTDAKLAWFVGEYPTDINDTSVDNTTEIQSCLDSGFLNIEFPTDKYLHITSTLVIDKPINIITRKEKYFNDDSGTNNGLTSEEPPCLFSKSCITLLSYVIEGSNTNISNSFNIGNIRLVVDKNYSDLSEKDTPILKIKTNGESIWGLNIYANIKAGLRTITDNGTTSYAGNYTGILFEAVKGYITFVTVYGDINNVHQGIVCKSRYSGLTNYDNWFTNLVVYGNIMASYGADLAGVSMFKMFGDSQFAHNPTTYRESNFYFHDAHDTAYIYGKVWDYTLNNGNWAGLRGVLSTQSPDIKNVFDLIDDSIDYPVKKSISNFEIPIYGNAFYDTFIEPRDDYALFVRGSLVYTLNNVDVLTNHDSQKIFNADYLFNDAFFFNPTVNEVTQKWIALVWEDGLNKPIHIEFIIANYYFGRLPIDLNVYFPNNFYENVSIVASTCSTVDGQYTQVYSENNIQQYYDRHIYSYDLKKLIESANFLKISIDGTLKADSVPLPMLSIPWFNRLTRRNCFVSTHKPRLGSWDGNRKGDSVFFTDLNKPGYWTGSGWVDATGTPV